MAKRKIEYRTIIKDSNDPGYVNRLLVATPTIGVVRVEWVQARYGQIIPVNWSMVQMMQFMDGFYPMRYQVSDAENLIVKEVVEREFEWLLMIEHDVLLPPDAFIRLNKYMRDAEIPIVSGLYYTRSRPSEPLVFRGRGNSVYTDWNFGDLVWADGTPLGCILIHSSILKELWNDSEEYVVKGIKTRRVFNTPRDLWIDPEDGQFNMTQGTSDLDWCTKIMDGKYFEKAGWPEMQEKEFPFLIDTNIFCRHINPDGEQFP